MSVTKPLLLCSLPRSCFLSHSLSPSPSLSPSLPFPTRSIWSILAVVTNTSIRFLPSPTGRQTSSSFLLAEMQFYGCCAWERTVVLGLSGYKNTISQPNFKVQTVPMVQAERAFFFSSRVSDRPFCAEVFCIFVLETESLDWTRRRLWDA